MYCLPPSVDGELGENLGGVHSRSFRLGSHVQAAWGGRGPGATCPEAAGPRFPLTPALGATGTAWQVPAQVF